MPRKRPDDLLKAYKQLSPDLRAEPHPYLLFVGDGEMRRDLEATAAATGWKSTIFQGFKNQTEIAAFYDLCDLFVMPSATEPWGLAVNEAMNAGQNGDSQRPRWLRPRFGPQWRQWICLQGRRRRRFVASLT